MARALGCVAAALVVNLGSGYVAMAEEILDFDDVHAGVKKQRGGGGPERVGSVYGLVRRDSWERVQVRLKQNVAFSPRNEKHPYLLKGLVQCGGCGSRYVGDAWHGRFYYRCSSRCKRLPAIRESQLEKLVVEPLERKALSPI